MMQNLESLSRYQLQALIKEYGLKGANKKTCDLQNILKEYYLLTPSPSLNELSRNLSLDVSQETGFDKIASQENLQEITQEDTSIQEEIVDRVNDEKECLKEQLLTILSQDSVNILQTQGLLDWNLLKSLEFKDFRDLGMKMSSFLQLRNLLNEIFPVKQEIMVPLSEIKNIVQNILVGSAIPKPSIYNKNSESADGVKKTALKKPGKYDNVKSKVAQQWCKKI